MNKNLIWLLVIIVIIAVIIGTYYFVITKQNYAGLETLSLNQNINATPVLPEVSATMPDNTNLPLAPVVSPPLVAPPPALPAVQEVQIANFAFNPASLTIKVGDTVTWINDDEPMHQIASASFGSSNLNTGDSFSFTFSQAGSYDYYCAIHPFMTGKIIVSQ